MQNAEFNYSDKLNNVYIDVDDIRTNIDRTDTLTYPIRMEESINNSNEIRVINDDINIQIYRYKFIDELMNELYIFAKVHQYDTRNVFKEAWELWLEENNNIVSSEVNRLTEIGYNGNIIEKMFKSARYYFRKKNTGEKEITERRIYIGVSKELLKSMDKHIISGIIQENYKPSDVFDEFCKIHIDLLKEQVHLLCKNGFTNSDEIKNKIKKTYKNRYFLVVKNINKEK